MIYKSTSDSQSKILASIVHLHNNGNPFDLDPCFNRGTMYYPEVEPPKLKFDIAPLSDDVLPASADALPLAKGSVRSMVLDPPWLLHTEDNKNKMATRFGSLRNKQELKALVNGFLKEGYRVLAQDGLLVLKCQDFIHDRRKFFMSIYFCNKAIELGFNPIDHFLYLPKTRMRNLRERKKSYASHSWHTHFYVFRKKRTRTDYLPISGCSKPVSMA